MGRDDEARKSEGAAPDTLRGEQLKCLQQCELPKDAKDKKGHPISALARKGVLTAIDHFSRGRPGGTWASVSTLAKVANLGQRTATRALEVLEELGLLVIEPATDVNRVGYRGSPTNKYTIVWSELRLLCYENPLARGQHRRSFSRPDQSALGTDQSALGTDQSALGTDQSALGTDQSALGTDQSAPRAHKSTKNRPRNDNEAPSNVDCAEDGAKRTFLDHELADIQSKVGRIHKHAKARTVDDCELLLKVATLWNDGLLADNSIEQVLESYQAKLDAGDPVRNTMGWLFTAMTNQCQNDGLQFERLLARCKYPAQMIPAWAEPGAAARRRT